VQKTESGGRSAVTRQYGFDDSPDAEIIAAGFNSEKYHGAVAIGRHGNILQWGFKGSPSEMTEAGKNLYVNCIVYIAGFDGKLPLIHREAGHRDNVLRLAALITQITNKSLFERTFSKDRMVKYKDDPGGLVKYYNDHYELIYLDQAFEIDKELQSLSIASNRNVETLSRLIELLDDKETEEIAQKLLGRYTLQDFTSHNQWQKWYDANKERIYFSDVGGYKFRVVPEGYLD
jgi:hypothetical protein